MICGRGTYSSYSDFNPASRSRNWYNGANGVMACHSVVATDVRRIDIRSVRGSQAGSVGVAASTPVRKSGRSRHQLQLRLALGELLHQRGEVAAGEVPLERLGNRLPVLLEAEDPTLERVEVAEVVWG